MTQWHTVDSLITGCHNDIVTQSVRVNNHYVYLQEEEKGVKEEKEKEEVEKKEEEKEEMKKKREKEE